MRIKIAIISLLFLFIANCSAPTLKGRPPTIFDDDVFVMLSREGGNVHILLKNGILLKGKVVDRTVSGVVIEENGAFITVREGEIQSVTYILPPYSRSMGFTGSVIGATFGYIYSAVLSSYYPKKEAFNEARWKAISAGIVIGGGIGTYRGSIDDRIREKKLRRLLNRYE